MHWKRITALGLAVLMTTNISSGFFNTVQASDVTENSYVAEGQAGVKQGDDIELPSGMTLTESDQAPVDTESIPTEPENNPTEPESTPAEPEDVPAKPEDVPNEPGDIPAKPEGVPNEPGDIPATPENVPTAPEKAPDQPEQTPADEVKKTEEVTETQEKAAVDKSELGNLLQAAKIELDHSSWYTPESFAAFVAAYEYAKQIYDNPNATQRQVNDALNRLQNTTLYYTLDGYQSYIDELILQVEGQMYGPLMYTPETWNIYSNAKTALLQVREKPSDFTQEQRWGREQAYVNAYTQLVVKSEFVDSSALKSAIDQANFILEHPANFTVETVNAVRAALGRYDQTKYDQLNSAESADYLRGLTEALKTISLSREGLIERDQYLRGKLAQAREKNIYTDNNLDFVEALLDAILEIVNNPASSSLEIAKASNSSYLAEFLLSELNMDPVKTKAVLANMVSEGSEYTAIYNEIKGGSLLYDKFTAEYYVESYDNAVAAVNAPQSNNANDYYDLAEYLETAKGYLVLTLDAVDSLIKSTEWILEVDKGNIGKEGGLSQADYDQIKLLYDNLVTVRNAEPQDMMEIMKAFVELDSFLGSMVRIPSIEKPQPPADNEHKTEVTPVQAENTSPKAETKTVKTGDMMEKNPWIMFMLSGAAIGASVIMKKRRDESEE